MMGEAGGGVSRLSFTHLHGKNYPHEILLNHNKEDHCDKTYAERYVLSLISLFVAHSKQKKRQKLVQLKKKR